MKNSDLTYDYSKCVLSNEMFKKIFLRIVCLGGEQYREPVKAYQELLCNPYPGLDKTENIKDFSWESFLEKTPAEHIEDFQENHPLYRDAFSKVTYYGIPSSLCFILFRNFFWFLFLPAVLIFLWVLKEDTLKRMYEGLITPSTYRRFSREKKEEFKKAVALGALYRLYKEIED